MTQSPEHSAVVSWTEPAGLNPRGTIVVIPGRGETPEVYERFGRRLSVDAYRVHAVANPVDDPALTEEQVKGLLDGPKPFVLAGSDTGALFAVQLAASWRVPADALLLAGLPTTDDAASGSGDWDAELEARTACPTPRGRQAGPTLQRAPAYEP